MLPLPILNPSADKPSLLFRAYTFGCKVNHADTAAMEGRLWQSGGRLAEEHEVPEVVIVNTCTVTQAADRQARQLLRRIHREHPQARIIVTGCYAEADPERIASVKGVSSIIPISKQNELPNYLGLESGAEIEKGLDVSASTRTRVFLKMQEGCNAYCSFCILPYVRGRSRSIPLHQLQDTIQKLQARGDREVVVTGTHLGAYGRDLSPRIRLSDALTSLSAVVPDVAIRVSSVEPTTLTRDLIQLAKSCKQIRPHFHIPLQSGSDTVLRRMNRKYKVAHYAQRIEALAQARSNMAIGADVIVGFPEETDEEFAETCRVVDELPITYLHVFPYSARPGTKAATRPDDVPGTVKKARVNKLRELGARKRTSFHSRFVKTTQSVLVEKKRDLKGRLCGYTPHYVPIRFEGPDRLMEKEIDVRLLQIEGEIVVGEAA